MNKRTLKKRLYKFLFKLFVVGAVALLLLFGSIYLGFWGVIPSQKQLTEIQQSKATEVISSDHKLLGKFYTTDRQPITFKQIPKHVINALVATEDVRFFEHQGVDNLSLFRVLIKSILLQNKSAGGGSTLSQQLAKNMFPRKNFGKFGIVIHKIREIIISNRLEKVYSKEELLTHYLNTVPFSDNTFGIESAAKKFFNKSTHQLSIDEGAVLIGMLKTNYYYNPRLFPKKSKKRRNVVLNQMKKYEYLDETTCKKLQLLPLELDYQTFSHNTGLAPYFREQVKRELKQWVKKYNTEHKTQFNLYNSGLKIHTTIDAGMQALAEEAMQSHLAKLQADFERSHGKNAPWIKKNNLISRELIKLDAYKKLKEKGLSAKQIIKKMSEPHDIEWFTWKGKKVVTASTLDSIRHYYKFLNTGFVSLEPTTGAIKTWIGGINFEHFKYDHVSQSKRQVGSTFKPIVYAAALEQGYSPCSYISNAPITYEDLDNWTPKNASSATDSSKEYAIWSALSNSLNVISVKLLNYVGIDTAIDLAYKMGIESELPKVPSLALGTAELNVLELAKAYTTLSNKGSATTPYYISKIEDASGNILETFEPATKSEKAFTENTRQQLVAMMQRVTDSGTAKRLRSTYKLKNDIAAKTGTTQDNKDGWFVGVTPKLVSVCWVGADHHSVGFTNTRIGQGANSALPIFAKWFQMLNKEAKYKKYTNSRFRIAPKNKAALNCVAYKDPNFLKKLFTKKDKLKRKRFDRQQKKKGFLNRLFGKKR
ncbi:penicillin-binding protein 1A [Aquimarina agarilytica]|uniref:penicillin-binding protein 1A n=1 Tax=Aquimarina agarilytica TaxID=1087449 RepID=UPI0002881FF1|nr:transglycosylase domain-containing protein [Aquimarina agarilytica]